MNEVPVNVEDVRRIGNKHAHEGPSGHAQDAKIGCPWCVDDVRVSVVVNVLTRLDPEHLMPMSKDIAARMIIAADDLYDQRVKDGTL